MAEWIFLFYVVAEPPLLSTVPATYKPFINGKAKALADAVKTALPENAIAAIRTAWDGPNGPKGSSYSVEVFNAPQNDLNIYSNTRFGAATYNTFDTDLREFFNWTQKNLEATHCAVFFWGHSFGPAGLFEAGGRLLLPNNANAGIALAANAPPPDSASANGPSGAMLRQAPLNVEDVRVAVATTYGKVDLVVFQDCWMSTLETACQLSDSWPVPPPANGVCSFIIASQSELPIGGAPDDPAKTGIWKFDALFPAIQNGIESQVWKSLFDYYKDQTLWGDLVALPMALLSMASVPDLAAALKPIVDALYGDFQLRKVAFLPSAYLCWPQSGDIKAGSDELVDVAKVLSNLGQAGVNAQLQSQIAAAQAALAKVVIDTGEWDKNPPGSLGFAGLSAMGGPPCVGGKASGYVRQNLTVSFYQSLTSSQQCGWHKLVFASCP